ncbi:hypothetical protein [Bradyrhizobium sp. MOS002]|uniref:hypothetical protein n=1 Tax=Bradyrhizobium sp. MOS002 TaxID=2133947 RepID=UPI000D11DF30|nr:hypothetical protein [Bradyrhizobium sp. MOS002]PSO30533.1 hypothetical protein C7G41_21290 [Bradyrhizobium sp. MOS002]
MMTLTKEQNAQIAEAARGLNTLGVENFKAAVVGRLDRMLAVGTVKHVTTPIVAAACTAELARGK